MKKFIFILSLAFFTFSCKTEKKNNETSTSVEETVNTEEQKTEAATSSEKQIEVDNEKLKEATPLSNDELKSFLPEELLNYKREKVLLGNPEMAEVSVVEAIYKNKNGKELKLSLIDGAGEVGSALVYMTKLSSEDQKQDTERGYKKSENINGHKVFLEIEKYKARTETKLNSLVNNRFLVTIDSKDNTLEVTSDFFKNLDFSKLK